MKSIWNEWKKIGQELGPAFAGLNLVMGVAIVARFLQGLLPGPTLNKAISEVLVAVVLGLYIRSEHAQDRPQAFCCRSVCGEHSGRRQPEPDSVRRVELTVSRP